MANKILIIDTSILCVWLEVYGKETCGSGANMWTKALVEKLIDREKDEGAIFVLPLAVIIETGNHITNANQRRHQTAKKLADLMCLAADEQSPWAAFTEQSILWNADSLKQLAQEWSDNAAQKISMGDITIKKVADFYGSMEKYHVEILTGDNGLKAFEPPVDTSKTIPKRRRNQTS